MALPSPFHQSPSPLFSSSFLTAPCVSCATPSHLDFSRLSSSPCKYRPSWTFPFKPRADESAVAAVSSHSPRPPERKGFYILIDLSALQRDHNSRPCNALSRDLTHLQAPQTFEESLWPPPNSGADLLGPLFSVFLPAENNVPPGRTFTSRSLS